jgi:hypothetical protein
LKKIILFCVLCVASLLSASWSRAAGNLDTVALSNGTVIQGTILESSNDRVKIQTTDGTVMVLSMTDVDQIRRGAVQPQTLPPNAAVPRRYVQGSFLRKDPNVALHMSYFFPGGGQFYSDQSGKGALQLGLFIGGIIVAIAEAPQYEYTDYYDDWGYYEGTNRTLKSGNDGACAAGICVALGSWIWSVIDAPGCAEKYNREHGLALYENPLKNQSLAIEPVLFNAKNQPQSGMQVAYRF